ncbi:MAG TPA: DNA replication/repair protein RecF [Massilibacterium sp.]|nr:DNA replication/repair protein RecF [Massilibacterium sp.]
MYLTQLDMKNFRNYEDIHLTFENKVNIIIGENAQGKTSLMEAIYVLAMAKSHRATKDKELIRFEENYAKIEGRLEKRNGPLSLELVISKKGKKAKCNSLEQRRLSDYIGHMNVVMFAPEDLSIVKGSPQVRRRFIDMELGQISPIYMHDLSQYQKVLHQRNQFLKTMNPKKESDLLMLEVLTEQFITLAAKVVKKRLEFIQLLLSFAKPLHESISRGLEVLTMEYKPSVKVLEHDDLPTMITAYKKDYERIKEREWERRTSLFGPHRDDLIFYVNQIPVQIYGSQGQQRTTALSLKLAEIELIKSEVGEYPILLLDDVLSELDDFRQTHLLNTIQGKVQTFVTTTSVEGISHETIEKATKFEIHNGQIVKIG